MKLSNNTYDRLKFIALVVLPALAVLYGVLGDLWGLPDPTKVAASIVALDTFLGIVLQINTTQYKAAEENAPVDGYISANGEDPDTGIPNITLTVTKHPQQILDGKVAKFKIGDAPPPK